MLIPEPFAKNPPIAINSDTAQITLTRNLTMDLKFQVIASDNSVAHCTPGHSVAVNVSLTLLQDSELYVLRFNFDGDLAQQQRKFEELKRSVEHMSRGGSSNCRCRYPSF